jgi:hypothetical protein
MDLDSIVTYLSMKDMNARETSTDMNNTLGTDCIGYSTVAKYLREKLSRSRCLTRISSRKLKREISLMMQFLGLFRNTSFPYSARLPQEYPFQSVHFGIIWSVLWGIESGIFGRFPTRSHQAKSKYRDESRSSSSSPVSRAPRLEIYCYTV